jgi:cytochrome c oxidase cbb3-type subunit 2
MSPLLLVAGGSTLVYAVLALMMGVLPGIALSRIPPGPGVEPLTALQAEGRDVYVANGCSYCHTQQVRPLPQDKVFGRPSAPGDFAYQTPELLGSERTGPDLTNIGKRQPSEVWQYLHLYNPRAVVPESIMPAFDWLFEVVDEPPPGVTPLALPAGFAPSRGVVVPTRQSQALLAYLLSLKQPDLPGGAAGDGDSAAPHDASTRPGTAPASAAARVASAAPAVPSMPLAGGTPDVEKGRTLFMANCSACHQANGEGIPGVFPPLKGNAAVNAADPAVHIGTVLHGLPGGIDIGGVKYSSPMPGFADALSDADIASIVGYERSAWGNRGDPVSVEQVTAARAGRK